MELTWGQKILAYWRLIIIIVYPLLLLPIFVVSRSQEYKCGYIILVSVGYWMAQVSPHAVIRMIPLVLFPCFLISTPQTIALCYFQEQLRVFLYGNILVLAVVESELVRRIVLNLILICKCDLRKLHILVMVLVLLTAITSMDIIAAVVWCYILQDLMMYLDDQGICRCFKDTRNAPDEEVHLSYSDYQMKLKQRILEQSQSMPTYDVTPKRSSGDSSIITEADSSYISTYVQPNKSKLRYTMVPTRITKCFFLGVLFSSQLGGLVTFSSSFTNRFIARHLVSHFPHTANLFPAYKWPIYGLPYAIVCMVIIWTYLQLALFGLWRPKSKIYAQVTFAPHIQSLVERVVQHHLADMGPLAFREIAVICGLAVYWTLQGIVHLTNPYNDGYDTALMVLTIVAFFVIPSKPTFIYMFHSDASRRPKKVSPSILSWTFVQKKVVWSVLFIGGGTIAIAAAMRDASLDVVVQDFLMNIKASSPYVTLVISCSAATFMTQFVDNTEVPRVILPYLVKKGIEEDVHPLFYMIPTVFACSFGYCFYISSVVNAVVACCSNISQFDMFRYNLAGLIISFSILIATAPFLIPLTLGVHEYPNWPKY